MATTLRRNGCTLIVEIRLEFQNNTGRLNANQFTALVNGWETSIETLWNGPNGRQRFRCCRVKFDVITRIGAGAPGFHQVNVRAGPATSSAGLGPAGRNATWDDLDTGNVVAHETGHLMGLPDEYDYGGPNGAYRNLNPQPAGQPQSIMAQTWGNVAALQSHIDAILRGLNAKCSWYCCILCFFEFFRLFQEAPVIARSSVGADMIRSVSATSTQSVDEILQNVEKGDPDALAAGVDVLTQKGRDVSGQLIEELRSRSALRRWVAAAALAQIADARATDGLNAALKDENASVRAMAAFGLAKLRVGDGVAALIEQLESDEVMIGHPPQLIGEFAGEALQSVTGKKFEGDARNAARQWRDWWRGNKDSFGRTR